MDADAAEVSLLPDDEDEGADVLEDPEDAVPVAVPVVAPDEPSSLPEEVPELPLLDEAVAPAPADVSVPVVSEAAELSSDPALVPVALATCVLAATDVSSVVVAASPALLLLLSSEVLEAAVEEGKMVKKVEVAFTS